jgi:type VI secretion system secreted protein Hcp
MAVDMFLKIEGVKGEAVDLNTPSHADEISVLAWSWGASNSGTTHISSGSGAGKVNVQDISLTKYVDSSSVELFLRTCSGKHFPSAVLTCRKAGDKPLEYIIITMTDLMITSYHTGGSGGEDRLTENISINFAKAQVQYFKQNPDGTGVAAGDQTFDIQANFAQA